MSIWERTEQKQRAPQHLRKSKSVLPHFHKVDIVVATAAADACYWLEKWVFNITKYVYIKSKCRLPKIITHTHTKRWKINYIESTWIVFIFLTIRCMCTNFGEYTWWKWRWDGVEKKQKRYWAIFFHQYFVSDDDGYKMFSVHFYGPKNSFLSNLDRPIDRLYPTNLIF